MFNDTKVVLLSGDFEFVRSFYADVQPIKGIKGIISLDYGLSLEISKRLFCDLLGELDYGNYLFIKSKLYKPLEIINWDGYTEARLYECRRDDVIRTIDELFDFFFYEMGVPITIDGTSTAAVILDSFDRISEYDDKHLMLKTVFSTGSIAKCNDWAYLVMSDVVKNTNSYVGKMRKTNYRISFNYEGDVQWFDVFIESNNMGIEDGKIISIPQGELFVYMQENEESLRAKLGQRFINTGRAWKVTGIDRSRVGIIKFTCEIDAINSDDNMELEIADYYKYVRDYTLTINNIPPIEVQKNTALPLQILVTDGGKSVYPLPALVCTSSNTAIAVVTKTGVISGIEVGSVVISCAVSGYPDTKKDADVTVTSQYVPPVFTVSITGSSTIKCGGSTRTYTAVVYQDGTEITGKSVVWSVANELGGTPVMATLSAQTALTCGLTAVDNDEYIGETVILTAKISDMPDILFNFEILITSLWG